MLNELNSELQQFQDRTGVYANRPHIHPLDVLCRLIDVLGPRPWPEKGGHSPSVITPNPKATNIPKGPVPEAKASS